MVAGFTNVRVANTTIEMPPRGVSTTSVRLSSVVVVDLAGAEVGAAPWLGRLTAAS